MGGAQKLNFFGLLSILPLSAKREKPIIGQPAKRDRAEKGDFPQKKT